MRKLVFLLVGFSLFGVISTRANNIYIAQSATGAANGADCADAFAVSFFNSSANWGTAANQIGPGTTVHLCGTFIGTAGQTLLTFQGSGASGNPTTLLFESGAQLTAPYFSASSGAINLGGRSYLVVDGGTNGLIENTQNGTNGAACPGGPCSYSVPSRFLVASSASNVEIKNLRMLYGYYHTSNSDTSISANDVSCIYTNGIGNNLSIHDNVAVDSNWCIDLQFGNSANGLSIYNNSISRIDHGIALGGNPGGALSNINIYSNHIYSFANWDTSSDSYHHDGIHAYGNSSTITNLNIYNNLFEGPNSTCPSSCMTGHIFIEVSAGVTNESIYNNVFLAGPTDVISSGGGMLGVYSGTSPVLIANNTVYGGGANSLLCFGANQTMTGVTLENNVFASCSTLSDIANVTFTSANYNLYAAAASSNSLKCGSGFYSASQFAAYKTCTGEGALSLYSTSAGLNGSGIPQSGSAAIGIGLDLCSVASLCSTYSALASDTSAGDTRAPQLRLSGAWTGGAYAYPSDTGSLPAAPTGLVAAVN